MELRQLEYLEAVVKYNSYTKAAQNLYVSEPSITLSIQKLEIELGLILLVRDNKKLLLTKEGEEFLKYAKKILKNVEYALKAAEDMRINNKKIVKFAFPSTLGSWLWGFINNKFGKNHDDIDIIIKDYGTSEIIRKLQLGEIDLGYGVINLVEGSSLESKVIQNGNMKIILSKDHKYANMDSISLEKLEDDIIIMYREGTTYVENKICEEFKKHSINPRINYVVEQSTVYDLVAQNLGIAFTLDDSATFIKHNKYLITKPTSENINFEIGLIWDGGNYLSSSTRILMDEIINWRE